MKKLLVCGDSFAADWTVKYKGRGWVNLLDENFAVTNLARAGVCEYKIYQQLISQDLRLFDAIIVAHTSPYRLYVKEHPIHSKDSLHSDCDLIYTDLVESLSTHPELKSIVDYFERYFDTDYAKFVHGLICEKIQSLCDNLPVINLINFKEQFDFKNSVSFVQVFEQHRGTMNHFDDAGNKIVYETVLSRLNEIIK